LSELVLLLPNTDCLQQLQMFSSDLVLPLPNTDSFQQFEDFFQILFYFYQIQTAFNNLKICQSLFFYQILTAFNNLKIVPELVLPLPNTDSFQQFWRFLSEFVLLLLNTDSFNNLKILSELVLPLPNTDSFQQFEDFCQS
jgi:hypothetical protein